MSFRLRRIVLSSLSLVLATSCRKASSERIWTQFSGEKALAHVQHLVDFGPRPAGSEAIEKSRAYIKEQLKSCGWTVTEQAFTDQTPRGPVQFVNLIAASGNGLKVKPLLLLCGHYDTKIFDAFRFVGANDGGSSTGVLLEVARVLAKQPRLAEKVQLVFFDGEEAVENFSDTDGIYGSRHFAGELAKDKSAKSIRGGELFYMGRERSPATILPPNSPSENCAVMSALAAARTVRTPFHY